MKKGVWKSRVEAILIAFAIIAFWRGIWGLMDLYLFPKNTFLSYGISFLLGLIILILTRSFIDRRL